MDTNNALRSNSLDNQLIEASAEIFSEISKKLAESPFAQEIDKFMDSSEFATWESWFKIFKLEAGEENPQLQVGDDGFSLIDLMDGQFFQQILLPLGGEYPILFPLHF